MRLHRDDEPDASEPDEGWVQGSVDPEQTALTAVLQDWTVVRCWRHVPGRTATEAIEAAVGDHDEVRVSRQEMTMLYLTREELEVAASACGGAISRLAGVMGFAQTEAVKSATRSQLVVLNSLRTAFTEARYTLMTTEQVQDERQAFADAVAEGIVTEDVAGPARG